MDDESGDDDRDELRSGLGDERHSTRLCCFMNRKGKSFIQCFCRNNKIFCDINSYSTCSNAVFRH